MTIHRNISIELPTATLFGDLSIPDRPEGLVLFSHGSGSSRKSPRNGYVADILVHHGFATLLFDLLSEEEDRIPAMRFNIGLLTERLVATTRWIAREKGVEGLPIGYFGASTGAASALRAAAKLPEMVEAVVSRGGRPDLADSELVHVQAPTLLIVGAMDTPVIELNRRAMKRMPCIKEMRVVAGAGHLFEEPGTLAEVAQLASEWFEVYLTSEGHSSSGDKRTNRGSASVSRAVHPR